MPKRLFLKIYGQVQGVGFRANIYYLARELGLVGWVRNASDSSVEILAEGEEEKLKRMIGYCKEGPRFAKIDEVEIKWAEASGEFGEFVIR